MALSEFDLIRQYFTRPGRHTLVGVGDDAALMEASPGQSLAASSDMLVAGRHFFPETDPYRLGRKSVAVNASDLAAMGANPRWILASIALPRVDERWIAAFAKGFAEEAEAHGMDWVGGDTTAGPLNIAVTVLGEVPKDQALLRSGARVGDEIYVSGSIGDAALGLEVLLKKLTLPDRLAEHVVQRLECPTPRVGLGLKLRGVAHAAIDISDGLVADLGHLLQKSKLGATIEWSAIPILEGLPPSRQIQDAVLGGGDDYELCFTASSEAAHNIQAIAKTLDLPLTRIGQVRAQAGLEVLDSSGQPMVVGRKGFDHFGAEEALQQ